MKRICRGHSLRPNSGTGLRPAAFAARRHHFFISRLSDPTQRCLRHPITPLEHQKTSIQPWRRPSGSRTMASISSNAAAMAARDGDERLPLSATTAAGASPVAAQLTTERQADEADYHAGSSCEQPQGSREEQQQQQSKKRAKPQPTHFVALQVSQSPEVLAAIQAVQAALLQAAPQLQPCLLEPETAHLTVMVLQLANQEQSDAVGVALAELGPLLQQQQLLTPLELELRGLSHFRHQVLYLDVAEGPGRDRLMRLAQQTMQHFRAAGLMIEEGRAFTPHITVAKTSRLIGKHRHGGRSKVKIPEEAWASHADVAAGCVIVAEIQVCAMQGRRAGDYYKLAAELLRISMSSVTHRLELQKDASADAAAPAEPTEAAAAAAVGAMQQAASPAPLKAARRRFKRLLSAMVCGTQAAAGE